MKRKDQDDLCGGKRADRYESCYPKRYIYTCVYVQSVDIAKPPIQTRGIPKEATVVGVRVTMRKDQFPAILDAGISYAS